MPNTSTSPATTAAHRLVCTIMRSNVAYTRAIDGGYGKPANVDTEMIHGPFLPSGALYLGEGDAETLRPVGAMTDAQWRAA